MRHSYEVADEMVRTRREKDKERIHYWGKRRLAQQQDERLANESDEPTYKEIVRTNNGTGSTKLAEAALIERYVQILGVDGTSLVISRFPDNSDAKSGAYFIAHAASDLTFEDEIALSGGGTGHSTRPGLMRLFEPGFIIKTPGHGSGDVPTTGGYFETFDTTGVFQSDSGGTLSWTQSSTSSGGTTATNVIATDSGVGYDYDPAANEIVAANLEQRSSGTGVTMSLRRYTSGFAYIDQVDDFSGTFGSPFFAGAYIVAARTTGPGVLSTAFYKRSDLTRVVKTYVDGDSNPYGGYGGAWEWEGYLVLLTVSSTQVPTFLVVDPTDDFNVVETITQLDDLATFNTGSGERVVTAHLTPGGVLYVATADVSGLGVKLYKFTFGLPNTSEEISGDDVEGALGGTGPTPPSATNRYVTDDDPRLAKIADLEARIVALEGP